MIRKCLEYDMISSPVDIHPQLDMKRLGLNGYYKAVPETVFDCWYFLFEEWPDVELPDYIRKKELDDKKFPELRPRLI